MTRPTDANAFAVWCTRCLVAVVYASGAVGFAAGATAGRTVGTR